MVKQLCLEYETFQMDDAKCRLWVDVVEEVCLGGCGECESQGEAIFDTCRFALSDIGSDGLTIQYCQDSQSQFINGHCVAACTITDPLYECDGSRNPAADEAMEACGNYFNCECRQQRGTINPDLCTGETINEPGQSGCENIPEVCMYHISPPGKYIKYAFCPPNFCIVKQIQCLADDKCMGEGICSRYDGRCTFPHLQSGVMCDDKQFFTYNDTCDGAGSCRGVIDKCLKYGISCVPGSPCQEPGICRPDTGRCIFEFKENGIVCDDQRPYTVGDRCENGLCIGHIVDLCDAVRCTPLDDCHMTGVCDP